MLSSSKTYDEKHEHQPRERAVMCRYSTMSNPHTTWNHNAICDTHQSALAQVRKNS